MPTDYIKQPEYKINKVELIEYDKNGQECNCTNIPHPISIFYNVNTAKNSLEDYYKGFGEWRYENNKFICNYARDGVAFAIVAQVENKG